MYIYHALWSWWRHAARSQVFTDRLQHWACSAHGDHPFDAELVDTHAALVVSPLFRVIVPLSVGWFGRWLDTWCDVRQAAPSAGRDTTFGPTTQSPLRVCSRGVVAAATIYAAGCRTDHQASLCGTLCSSRCRP